MSAPSQDSGSTSNAVLTKEAGDTVGHRVEPASACPLEQRLTLIWQDMFEVETLNPDDNFFELGGDSVSAFGMIVRLEEEFRQEISLPQLLEAPTIRQLATLLSAPQPVAHSSAIVAIRREGSRRPLFCCPCVHGELMTYRHLASQLPADRPMYVFEPLGLDGKHEPHRTLPEMAAYYLQHMHTLQPRGPYHLIGYSLGGTIVYEMAQQLRAQGESVSLLALIDAPTKGRPWLLRELKELVNPLWEAVVQRLNRLDAPLPANRRIAQIHRRALDLYRIQSYPGQLVLFTAEHGPDWMVSQLDRLNPTWSQLCGGVEVIAIPGKHSTLFHERNLSVLASEFQRVLAAAEA